MFLLLSILAPLASSQVTVPSTPDFPFEGIEDPSKQCVDINCFGPVEWLDNQLEVCIDRKVKTCKPMTEKPCIDIPVTTCEVVGYTMCDKQSTTRTVRDDEVKGANFVEQKCETEQVDIKELKKVPKCIDQTKNVCEKMWIPEEPFWKDINCQELTWQNCTLVDEPHVVRIENCECKPQDTWYDEHVKSEKKVTLKSTTCVPKAVPVCKQSTMRKCAEVEWEECHEEVVKDCSKQHFRIPEQSPDHRRWCSHVNITIPSSLSRPATNEIAQRRRVY